MGATSDTSVRSARPRARAIRDLREWIAKGQLRTGDVLPSEEKLADRLKVARMTLRAALKQLELDGLVVQRGRYRVVAEASAPAVTTSRSIAILSGEPRMNPATTRQPGWDHFVLLSAVDTIRAAGLNALWLQSGKWDETEIRALVAERARGLMVFRYAFRTDVGQRLVSAAQKAGIPTVIYGFEDGMPACDSVSSDHVLGQYLVTRHLLERGRRRILRFWKGVPAEMDANLERPNWLRRRDEGYERALKEAGLSVLDSVEYRSPISSGASARGFAMEARLAAGFLIEHLTGPDPVDAIVCNTDGATGVVAAACELLGKKPNVDVLIAGYDNYFRETPEQAFYPFAPCATVDRNNLQVGQELAGLLLARMNGELSAEPQHRLVTPTLIPTTEVRTEDTWSVSMSNSVTLGTTGGSL